MRNLIHTSDLDQLMKSAYELGFQDVARTDGSQHWNRAVGDQFAMSLTLQDNGRHEALLFRRRSAKPVRRWAFSHAAGMRVAVKKLQAWAVGMVLLDEVDKPKSV